LVARRAIVKKVVGIALEVAVGLRQILTFMDFSFLVMPVGIALEVAVGLRQGQLCRSTHCPQRVGIALEVAVGLRLKSSAGFTFMTTHPVGIALEVAVGLRRF